MKFIHLGDIHIGKSLGEYDLLDDQKYILDEIVDIAASEKAYAIIMAGDIYDKAVPSEGAVRLLDYFIKKIVDNHIEIYMISGNHDSDERLNFASSLLEKNGVHICGKYNGSLYKHTVSDEYGNVNIYLLPFVKRAQVAAYFPDEQIDNYDAAVKKVIAHADINNKERNIIVSHQFVVGGEAPQLAGSEGLAVKNVGLVEQIHSDTYDIFDYAALGHIHSAQKIGREQVRYSGSPLKYSLSEAGNNKSVPVVTLLEKNNIDIKLIELKPRRDLRHIKGKLENLIDRKNIVSPQDYIYATITDDDPVMEAPSIIRQYYPNTVRVDYDNAHTRQADNIEALHETAEKSFEELISDFYMMMYGCEISEKELEVISQAAGGAGVINEAD